MKFRIILLILFLFSAVNAQNPQLSPTPPIVEEDCGLADIPPVQINVSVWSSKIGYVKDFTNKDFDVSYANAPHEIDVFALENKPASIGLLFDLSGSMKSPNSFNKVSVAVESFRSFLKESNSENEYSLFTFAKEVSVLQEPTQSQEEIYKALDKVNTSELKDAKTLFYDGVGLGYEKLLGGKHAKKILIALTDGADNQSKKRLNEIKTLSRKESVQLYIINVVRHDYARDLESFLVFKSIPVLKREVKNLDSMSGNISAGYFVFNPNLTDLDAIVAETGGRIFYPTDAKETDAVFREIAEEIKSQYTLGFYPKFLQKDWGKIEIKLNLLKEKRDKLGKVAIRTKRGYYSKKD